MGDYWKMGAVIKLETTMDFIFQVGHREYSITINQVSGNHYQTEINGEKINFTVSEISDNCLSIFSGGRSYTLYFGIKNKKTEIFIKGNYFEIEELDKKGEIDQKSTSNEEIETDGKVSAPMPGKILKILVSEDQIVQSNDTLFIIESMKMENEVKSPIYAKVSKLNFSENCIVSTGDPVVELEKISKSEVE
jgi:biotin carboxyl carrier protein